jgi:hypothetical protein
MTEKIPAEEDFKKRFAMPEISGEEWNKLMAARGEREIKIRELWAIRARALDREFVRRHIKILCGEIRAIDWNYKRGLL